MKNKKLVEYKKKYDLSRHHGWAGLGFLSVLLAIRIIFPEVSDLLQPILVVVILYIIVSLIFTYKYYKGLTLTQENTTPSDELKKEEIRADVEKARLKLEKKKVKSELKAIKKSNKK